MSTDLLESGHVPAGASVLSLATHRLSRLLRSQLATLLSRHGNLSLVDWRICVALSERGTSPQKGLADFAKMEQGQISRSLSLMQTRGLIRSERSDRDKRVWLYSLTDEGRSHFHKVLPVVADRCKSIDNTLSPSEREQFLDMAQRLARASLIPSRKTLQGKRKSASEASTEDCPKQQERSGDR